MFKFSYASEGESKLVTIWIDHRHDVPNVNIVSVRLFKKSNFYLARILVDFNALHTSQHCQRIEDEQRNFQLVR